MPEPIKYYPVVDQHGWVRAMSMIHKGQSYTCRKLSIEVAKAIAEVLGDEATDWTTSPQQASLDEIKRRKKGAPEQPYALGAYKIGDHTGRLWALVTNHQGREEESGRIANQVALRVGAFLKEQCTLTLVNIQTVQAMLPGPGHA